MYEELRPVPFSEATGKIRYNMLNDCMFHLVLQNNSYALKGLIASLLHRNPEEIKSTEVKNPIFIGDSMDSKTFILDVIVEFNDSDIIDLEMQVKDYKNWIPRSMSYLCREFLNLEHGDNYNKVKGAYHVGFLDYDLFPDHREFYATYRMRNIKDGHNYTDKFTLSVVSLNQTELATDDDIKFGIDTWVKSFKATTWEELKMIAQNNSYIDSVAQSIYGNNLDPRILELCKKRQEEIDGENHRIQRLAKLETENLNLKNENSIQATTIAEQASTITEQASEIERLRAALKANNINAD